jgi:hypothetical protein
LPGKGPGFFVGQGWLQFLAGIERGLFKLIKVFPGKTR